MLNKLNLQLQSSTETPSFQGVAFLSRKIFRFCEFYKTDVFS